MDKTTIVATHMNGEPLPAAHGGPFRLVVPGWSGNHWMKWLKVLQPQPQEQEGFYQKTGYRMPNAPIQPGAAVKPADTGPATTFPIKSVIARPANQAMLKPGRQEIVGVAFSGVAEVGRVDVSIDGGREWKVARLEGPAGVGRWQVFRLAFDAKPGTFVAVVRAADKNGVLQPAQAAWNPSGYFWNGWHTIAVRVAS
jgi:DMSO/TMAO reductase YedYZ molybdopterin-dependent catalytic subunit